VRNKACADGSKAPCRLGATASCAACGGSRTQNVWFGASSAPRYASSRFGVGHKAAAGSSCPGAAVNAAFDTSGDLRPRGLPHLNGDTTAMQLSGRQSTSREKVGRAAQCAVNFLPGERRIHVSWINTRIELHWVKASPGNRQVARCDTGNGSHVSRSAARPAQLLR